MAFRPTFGLVDLMDYEPDTEVEDKLRELHKCLRDHSDEKVRCDDNLDNIFKISDLLEQDPQRATQYQKTLKGLYNSARESTEREIDHIKKALEVIHEVRATRYARLTSRNGGKPKAMMSKIALMKVMRHSGATLPLWVGRSDECPPPLCGAIPADPGYIVKVGNLVAALVRMSPDAETENWIVAEVRDYNAETRQYRVDDIDISAQNGQHVLIRDRVIPLPLMRANPVENPEAIFPQKACVLALYPQTTCFYPAVVQDPPSKPQDPYRLMFEDDDYECGYSPPLRVDQRYVLNFRETKTV